MDQLPRSGKRELICLLLFTCNYVVSVWRGFLFLWVLGMGYVILLWHSLSHLQYNNFAREKKIFLLISLVSLNVDSVPYSNIQVIDDYNFKMKGSPSPIHGMYDMCCFFFNPYSEPL